MPPVPGLLPTPGASPSSPLVPRPDRPPGRPCAASLPLGRSPLGEVVFPCDFPDPMVLRAHGRYYAYGTGWGRRRGTFPILTSTNLRGWRPAGDALGRPPAWSRGHMWAPTVLAARGRFYLYYSARRASDGLHCLAVATGWRPAGPFRDRGVIRCADRRGRGYIDPAPLVHRGRVYLFFSVDGPRHSISVLRLRRDLLRARGGRRTLFGVTRPWQRSRVSETVEGPWPLRRGKRFYLFYSAACWCRDYRMGYAVATRPLGPYRDAGANPILSGTPALVGPGGGSLFSGRGRSWLAFHAWAGPPGYPSGGVRSLRVAPVSWRNGRPQVLLR